MSATTAILVFLAAWAVVGLRALIKGARFLARRVKASNLLMSVQAMREAAGVVRECKSVEQAALTLEAIADKVDAESLHDADYRKVRDRFEANGGDA